LQRPDSGRRQLTARRRRRFFRLEHDLARNNAAEGLMPKIEVSAIPRREGAAAYPAPYDEPCRARARRALGDAARLSQFGVNLLHLPPQAWSSQRHWHTHEDEFIWVVEGQVVLVSDAGEEILQAGDCAGFPAGVPNGHHLQNRSDHPAVVLEIGSRHPETDNTEYPDIDLRWTPAGRTRKDGTPWT
jgi:uncharacterized cupin superfamily protein